MLLCSKSLLAFAHSGCLYPPCLPPRSQLHYLRLPKDIGEDHVVLMDCTVSTGAAAMMAVRVLLVRELCLYMFYQSDVCGTTCCLCFNR